MDRDRALRSVPSWVNEKAIGVPVNRTLWVATTFSATLFLIIGFSGSVYADVLQGPVTATCYRRLKDPLYNCPNSLLQVFTEKATAAWASSPVASVVLQTSVYGFPIFSIVSSIPVFSIIVKYNLVENGFSPRSGFLWGVVFPWLAGHGWLYACASAVSKLRSEARVAVTARELLSLGDATDDALRGVFDKFDTNGDGGLDASELKVALRGAVGLELSLDDCRQLVAFADRDGTGRLEFDEFRAVCRGRL